ncbi:MAG: glycosyltransferase family 39 protein, partial [Acidobacteria bacterium]|nr:glycosyltransferase family 39 protein [Acidobacteriota bacterium]
MFQNHSLWEDEAYVAVDILNRSFKELFLNVSIFPHQPNTPLLFNFILKIFHEIFGRSEISLRLLSIFCSCAALPYLFHFGSKYFNPRVAFIATLFLTFSPQHIQFSTEVKPYTLDVLVALFLLDFFLSYRHKAIDIRGVIKSTVIGIIFVWFSNISIILLTSGTLFFLYKTIKDKNYQFIVKVFIGTGFWLMSYSAIYVASIKGMLTNQYMCRLWGDYIYHGGLFSIEYLKWISNTFLGYFQKPFDHIFPQLPLIFVAFGWIHLFRKRNNEAVLLSLVFIIPFVLSSLGKFPFTGRMLLFTLPVAFLMLSYQLDIVLSSRRRVYNLLGFCFIFITLYSFYVKFQGIQEMKNIRCEAREAMAYFNTHYVEDDEIALNLGAQFMFLYYVPGQILLPSKFTNARQTKKSQFFKPVVKVSNGLQSGNDDQVLFFNQVSYVYNSLGKYRNFIKRNDNDFVGFFSLKKPTFQPVGNR